MWKLCIIEKYNKKNSAFSVLQATMWACSCVWAEMKSDIMVFIYNLSAFFMLSNSSRVSSFLSFFPFLDPPSSPFSFQKLDNLQKNKDLNLINF